jgi:phenylalanyl-tRNA synthetase beta chain
MPSLTLNREVVEKMIGKKLPDDKLKHDISYLGTDLEGIEDNKIDVEIFPNRPDLLSEQGMGRALASFVGTKKGLKEFKMKPSGEKLIIKKQIKEWPHVVTAIVRGLTFSDEKIREIVQIQEKLAVTFLRQRGKGGIGLYPLDKIKFPVYWTANNPDKFKFRPLEFPKEITGKQILSKHPTGREYGHICDGWKELPYFVDSDDKIMSMPPIINSHDMGKITEDTKDVFVEATGTDLRILKLALNMIVAALYEMGGKVETMEISGPKNYTTPDFTPSEMKLDVADVNKLLGLELDTKKVADNLEKMGYGIKKSNSKSLGVLIPAYRADILHPVDLIEDVAIAYGYDNFIPTIPEAATIGKESDKDIFVRKLSEIIVGLGITEVNSFIISPSDAETTKVLRDVELIFLKNPSTKEYDCVRPWLVSSMLTVLQMNKRHEYPQNIFLTGRCAQLITKNPGYNEDDRISVALCGDNVTFTSIKQVLDHLMHQIGVEFSLEVVKDSTFMEGRTGKIIVDGTEVGIIGEINPEVLVNFELEMPTAILEINIDILNRLKV